MYKTCEVRSVDERIGSSPDASTYPAQPFLHYTHHDGHRSEEDGGGRRMGASAIPTAPTTGVVIVEQGTLNDTQCVPSGVVKDIKENDTVGEAGTEGERAAEKRKREEDEDEKQKAERRTRRRLACRARGRLASR